MINRRYERPPLGDRAKVGPPRVGYITVSETPGGLQVETEGGVEYFDLFGVDNDDGAGDRFLLYPAARRRTVARLEKRVGVLVRRLAREAQRQ